MKKFTLLIIILNFYCANIFAQNWTTDANTGLNDSNAVGTTDNIKLHFKTNDIIRGTFNTSGYFGIGTTSPNYSLHLNTPSSTECLMQMTNGTTGTGSTNGFKIGIDATGVVNILNYTNGKDIKFWTKNTTTSEKMRITYNGLVGIGTTTPSEKLDVAGNLKVSDTIKTKVMKSSDSIKIKAYLVADSIKSSNNLTVNNKTTTYDAIVNNNLTVAGTTTTQNLTVTGTTTSNGLNIDGKLNVSDTLKAKIIKNNYDTLKFKGYAYFLDSVRILKSLKIGDSSLQFFSGTASLNQTKLNTIDVTNAAPLIFTRSGIEVMRIDQFGGTAPNAADIGLRISRKGLNALNDYNDGNNAGIGDLDLWTENNDATHIRFDGSGSIDGQTNRFEMTGRYNGLWFNAVPTSIPGVGMGIPQIINAIQSAEQSRIGSNGFTRIGTQPTIGGKTPGNATSRLEVYDNTYSDILPQFRIVQDYWDNNANLIPEHYADFTVNNTGNLIINAQHENDYLVPRNVLINHPVATFAESVLDVNGNGTFRTLPANIDNTSQNIVVVNATGKLGVNTAGFARNAQNGCSMNSNFVELGNAVGGNSATLLSNREIPMSNYNLSFTGQGNGTNGGTNVSIGTSMAMYAKLTVVQDHQNFPYSPDNMSTNGILSLNHNHGNIMSSPSQLSGNGIASAATAIYGVTDGSKTSSGTYETNIGGYFAAMNGDINIGGYFKAGNDNCNANNHAIYVPREGGNVVINPIYAHDGENAMLYVNNDARLSSCKRLYSAEFDGDVFVKGKITYPVKKSLSDSILKTNISDINNALSKIRQIAPKSYDFKTSTYSYMGLPTGKQYGLIAQQIDTILPELVSASFVSAKHDTAGVLLRDSMTVKTLDYEGLIPFTIRGIQEVDSIQTKLKDKVDSLQIYPFNGLTGDSIRKIKLGGTLTEKTNIRLNNHNLIFSDPSSIAIDSNKIGVGVINPLAKVDIKDSSITTKTNALRVRNFNPGLITTSGGSIPNASTAIRGEALGATTENRATNIGGYFEAKNASINVAGYFNAGSCELNSHAIYTEFNGGNVNINGRAMSNSNGYMLYVNGEIECGDSTVTKAGYFVGDVEVTGDVTAATFNGSDARLKQNIQPMNNSMEIIKQLKPKTFEFRTSEYPQMGLQTGKQYGMLAQDVAKVLPSLVKTKTSPKVYDEDGNMVHDTVNYKVLNYTAIVPILVDVVKKQDSIISNLKYNDSLKLAKMNADIESLKAIVADLKKNNGNGHNKSLGNDNSNKNQPQIVELSNATAIILNQNDPNPFAENTVISYNIPSSVGKAVMVFYTNTGVVMKQVEITTRGAGQMNIYASDLSSGAYIYCLLADNKQIDCKKMMCTK